MSKQSNNHRKTILVAEDAEDILKEIVSSLEADYNILAKSRGDDARDRILNSDEAKLLPNSGLDLIISDAHMPGFHGAVLAEEVLGKLPGLPIIIYTSENPEYYGYLMKKGIDVFCKKDLTIKELAEYVRTKFPPYEIKPAKLPSPSMWPKAEDKK